MRNATTKRPSIRTLILLAEMLFIAAIHQFLMWTPAADCDEIVDPNSVEDPQPECFTSVGTRVGLDDEPEDPNAPDESDSPPPEPAAIGRL